jgi:hypothetical protein
MPIIVPIVSEFDGKGVSRAIKEFEQLETTGQKAQFALEKAALPAAAAMGALAVGIGAATLAAAEDAAAQDQLAGVLERTTGATEAQVAANEQFITSLSMAAAISDDQLRPAMAALAQVTGDVQVSQQLLTQAADIAAATNNDLATVTDALAKAYAGNMRGLQALTPELRDNIKQGQTFEQVMAILADTTGGAAARAADTAAGQMRGLKIRLDEAKESIGAAFLPILERLLPVLQKMAEFVQNNTTAIVIISGVIGTFAGAILAANAAIKLYQGALLVARVAQVALNVAMSANPIGLVITALGLLATAFAIAWNKSETFREIVIKVFNFTIDGANKVVQAFENVANAVINTVNAVIKAINAVSPFADIPTIGNISIGNIPKVSPSTGGGSSGTSGGSSNMTPVSPDRIDVPPTLPVVPTLPGVGGGRGGGGRAQAGGGGGGGGGGNGGGFSTQPLPGPLIDLDPTMGPGGIRRPEDLLRGGNINVTVNTVTAPEGLGQEIVDALRYYNRANGPIDILIAQ